MKIAHPLLILVAYLLTRLPLLSGELSTKPRYEELTGAYERSDGVTIYVVGLKNSLYASVSGRSFSLKEAAGDQFTLIPLGNTVKFVRDSNGKVVASQDENGTYPRKSKSIPKSVLADFQPKESNYTYRIPSGPEHGFEFSGADDVGLSSRLLQNLVNQINSDPDFLNFHSLLVERHGKLLLEEYFNGHSYNTPHNTRSATKSFISALVGAALKQSMIRSDEKPFSVIAEHHNIKISDHKSNLSLDDLLDMRHGLDCDDWNLESQGNERRIYQTKDWVETTLALPEVDESRFTLSYGSAIPLMVGRFLEIKSGKTLPGLAKELLLDPLKIKPNNWKWEFKLASKEDVNYHQVFLRPRDMLKFGRLYLNGGIYEKERILPEAWVKESFSAKQQLGSWRKYNNYWWYYEVRNNKNNRPLKVHFASGIGGQRIYIIPELDLTVVMTGGSYSIGTGGPRKAIEAIVNTVQ